MIPNMLYAVTLLVLRLYAGVMLKMDIHRKGSLPAGPVIYVPNHPSATDPFLIHLASSSRMSVLITEDAFKVPVFGWLLRKVREIPVPLKDSTSCLDHAHKIIQEGRSVVIFTEGQISPPGGGFWPARTGAARLALRSGAPIVPVGICLRRELGVTIRSKIKGRQTQGFWYLRGPYAMTIGKPIQLNGDHMDHRLARRITEVIMDQIRMLVQESEKRIRRPGSLSA